MEYPESILQPYCNISMPDLNFPYKIVCYLFHYTEVGESYRRQLFLTYLWLSVCNCLLLIIHPYPCKTYQDRTG